MPTGVERILVPPTDADKAYAAGFVDGEGCINLSMRTRTRPGENTYRSPILYVVVGNTFFPVLYWLQDRWGGTVMEKKPRPRRKPDAHWVLSARKAAAFLVDIRPFVIVKAAQADNALAFQRTRRGGGYIKAAEWALIDQFLAEQHRLNKRGPV